jgi:hypothetical protein
MANKRKRTRAKASGAKAASVKASGAATTDAATSDAASKPSQALPPPPEPAFWFGFEVAWAKLVVLRVVVFGLLALDALLSIEHAPRYGAGPFNVAQIWGLDALAPGRVVYDIGQLVNAFVFTLVAFGVLTRVLLPIATAIYAWFYFSSQLDSYQHHYLVSLLLLLSCFVPWQRPANATAATPVRSWALRLVLVQLAIMYLWAAISKLDPAWMNGHTLATQLSGRLASLIDHTIGMAVAANLVIAVELALAATVWWPRAWRYVAPLGLLFHLGIVATGFEIGLFAWLMIGLYALVVPDRVWIWLATRPLATTIRELASVVGGWFTGTAWMIVLAALALGAAALCRFDHALVVAIALGIPVIAWAIHKKTTIAAAACAGAMLLWLAVDRASTVAADYYSRWGHNARKAGNLDDAEHAYRQWMAIAPTDDGPHFGLGRVLLARDLDDGLDELHEAERLEPRLALAWVEEACYAARRGRRDDALARSRDALAADGNNAQAKRLASELARPGVPAMCAKLDEGLEP